MNQPQKIDSKRGIFTSKHITEQRPNAIPYLQQTLQNTKNKLEDIKSIISNTQKQIKQVNYLKPPTPNTNPNPNPLRLSQLNYPATSSTHNLGYTQTQTHTNIGNIGQVQKQTVITSPPIHFNYGGLHQLGYSSSSNIQGGTGGIGGTSTYTPIRGIPTGLVNTQYMGQSSQNIQFTPIKQNVQIIRRQVPLHIRNQIPARIYVNPPQVQPIYQYQQQKTHPLAQSALNQQAYNLLLKQYEKLYDRLQKQNQYTSQLQQQITKYKQYIHQIQQQHEHEHQHQHSHSQHYNQQTNITNITKKQTQQQQLQKQRQKQQKQKKKKIKYSLNVDQLHNQLYKHYEKLVKDIINNRKRQAKLKIQQAFAVAKKQVNTRTVVTQTVSYTNR